MRFYVQSYGERRPTLSVFPCVLLDHDNWDDYGFRTTCAATLFLNAAQYIDLGNVKIMHVEQTGTTQFPGPEFDGLPVGYASLGGKLDYYATLFTLGRDIYNPYLRGLRDVVYDDRIKAEVEDHNGFTLSLMRFAGAERTIQDGSRIFAPATPGLRKKNAGFVFRVKTRTGEASNAFTARFDFTRHAGLPNRVNSLIGYNGTGKTRLLSNIATVVTGYGYVDEASALDRTAGRIVGNPPPFGSVIVVSYSAFDTFPIPGRTAVEKARLERDGELFGYIYCGLRERIEYSTVPEAGDELYRVQTPAEIRADFLRVMGKIREEGRADQYRAVIAALLQDGSFQRSGLTPLLVDATEPELAAFFEALSSGHKIVLKIVSDLVANMDSERPTLVLFDEPETHLHPPLLSSLIRGLRVCLDLFDGFAILATHSPVLLQETPSRYATVLKRVGDASSIERPTIETFGESIGLITRAVFNLDEGDADWPEILGKLARRRTLEQVEEALDGRLGFTARSYFASAREETSR